MGIKFLIGTCFLLVSSLTFAQKGASNDWEVEGVVKNQKGDPLEGVFVSVKGIKRSSITNEKGYFTLKLPQGKHLIQFTHVGFQSDKRSINLTSVISREIIFNLNVVLKPSVVELSEVVISDVSLKDNVENSSTGLVHIGVKEIENIPTFLGELDIVKALTLLPGVSTVGEGAGGFNVRGGRIDQNLVMLDGVQLFNTSHVLGFYSIFNADLTKDFTLYKGNVPAQFGGRASSVLNVKSLKGNNEQINIKGSVGTVISKLSAEGPIGNKFNFSIGGRVTYANWILRKVSDLDIRNSDARFNDVFARLDYSINDKNNLRFSYYNSADEFKSSDDFAYEWSNDIYSLEWKSTISPKIYSSLSGSYMDYTSQLFDFVIDQSSAFENGVTKWQLKENVFVDAGKHQINLGAELVNNQGKNETFEPLDENSRITPREVTKDRGREIAFYANDVFKLSDRISINGGLRYTIYQNYGPANVIEYDGPIDGANAIDTIRITDNSVIQTYTGLSPRVSLKFGLGDNSSIKFSYNRLFQFIHLISNTAASTPVDLWQVSNTYFEPIQADNYSLGFYKDFDQNRWQTSIEVFYKSLDNVLEYRDFADLIANQNIETELLVADGRAYGLELLLKRRTNKWKGWISYSYTRSESRTTLDNNNADIINRGLWFPTNFDQPHNFKFVSDLKLGRNGSFGVNFVYNSGRPVTAVQSDYDVNSVVVPNFSDRNAFRIPNYIRLDMSFTAGSILKKVDDKMVFSIYNVFGRRNAYSVFYRRGENLSAPQAFKLSVLGSIFPSITYSFNLSNAK